MCKCKFNQFKRHQGKRCKWRHRHRVDGGGSGDQWRILADSRELSALPGRRSTENMDEATTKWFRLTITFTPPSLPRGRPSENGWGKKKKTRLPAARDTVSSIQRSINKAEQTVLSARCDPSAFTVRSVCTHARTHARPSLSQQRGRLPSFSSLLMSLPAWFYIHIWRHWAHFRLGGSDDERIISNVQKLPSSVAIDLEIWQKKKKDLWLFWGRLIMRLSVYFKRIYFIIVWTFSTHLC